MDWISWPRRLQKFGTLPAEAVLSVLVPPMSVFFWLSRIGYKSFSFCSMFTRSTSLASYSQMVIQSGPGMRSEVLKDVNIPITVLREETSYSLIKKHQRFAGTCCLHLQVGEFSSEILIPIYQTRGRHIPEDYTFLAFDNLASGSRLNHCRGPSYCTTVILRPPNTARATN